MAPCGVALADFVYEQCDVSFPWMIQPARMIVPWPEEEDLSLIATVRPFQSMVNSATKLS